MKRLRKIAFILALILCFVMPASAVKILPYNMPLQDIMKWDKFDTTFQITNPENESISVAWPEDVDLWNYDGDYWKYDLPDGDEFLFLKTVGINITSTEGEGATIRGISITDTVGAALGIHEGIISHITSAYMTGSWCNAVVGVITYSATGSAGGGMAAPFCSELNMQPAASSGGSYYNVHSYFNFPTNTELIDSTAFNYAFERYELAGGAKGEYDDYGDFFHIVGLTPADAHVLSEGYTTLRCLIDTYDKYLVLSRIENGLGMGGASPNQLNLDAASPLLQLYTTSEAITGTVYSTVIQQTMSVGNAALYEEVLRVQLIGDVNIGASANAIFASINYVEDGYSHGEGAVYAAEIDFPSVTPAPRGEYVFYKMEVIWIEFMGRWPNLI